jgi:hypothetical protein
MEKPQQLKYENEEMETTQETKRATALLRESGDLLVPHGGERLASISLHICAKPDVMSGQVKLFVITDKTEINVKPEVMKELMPICRDVFVHWLGGDIQSLKPKTVGETEEAKKEVHELAGEAGFLDRGTIQ